MLDGRDAGVDNLRVSVLQASVMKWGPRSLVSGVGAFEILVSTLCGSKGLPFWLFKGFRVRFRIQDLGFWV